MEFRRGNEPLDRAALASAGAPLTLSPLPVPDDRHLRHLIEDWPWFSTHFPAPRSEWLRQVEDVLRKHYPNASSRELSLTARGLAPFPLMQGPNVP